jgi:putative ABC transport system substrate-binding protein
MGPDTNESYRVLGLYAAHPQEEKPGDLPIQLPTKFEVVINLRTATALNLQIPDKLLALADEAI